MNREELTLGKAVAQLELDDQYRSEYDLVGDYDKPLGFSWSRKEAAKKNPVRQYTEEEIDEINRLRHANPALSVNDAIDLMEVGNHEC